MRIDIKDEIYLDYKGKTISPRRANSYAKVALIVLQKPTNLPS